MSGYEIPEVTCFNLEVRPSPERYEKYIAYAHIEFSDGKILDYAIHSIQQILFELNKEDDLRLNRQTVLTLNRA